MTEQEITKLKVGGLYRYKTPRSHARHGLMIIYRNRKGEKFACDTYWGSGDYSYVSLENLETPQYLFDMNRAKTVSEELWETYNDKDRAYIPMGGHSARYLVYKKATPSKDKQLDQLRGKIEKIDSHIVSQIRERSWLFMKYYTLEESK